MTCSCPKCNGQTELDPTDLPPEGLFNKCTECGTCFVVIKESFARRAIYKSAEITCAECGSHPGPSIYCQNCHAIYPDFLIIEVSSATKKKLGKLLKTLNALKTFNVGGAAKPSTDIYTATPSRTGKAQGLHLPGQPAQLLTALVIVLLISAGGFYYWYQDKQATTYTQKYVKALLGVKMARDLDLKISARLAADMKTGGSSALTATEQKSTASAKDDVDAIMKRIDKVPEKFSSSNTSLNKLYASYVKLHTTVISPSGSSEIYSGAVSSIDADFRNSAKELKSGLPEKIAAQFSESSKKFKALQDF